MRLADLIDIDRLPVQPADAPAPDPGVDILGTPLADRLLAGDADPQAVGDQAFRFLGTGAFTGVPGEANHARYGGNWVIVSADVNGDRVADMQIFVNLVTVLGAGDFVL